MSNFLDVLSGNIFKFNKIYSKTEVDALLNGISLMKIKPSDESVVSSSVLQPDDDLSFDLLSGETWGFEFSLVASELSTNPNLKLRLAATNGLTGSIEYHWNRMGTTSNGPLSDFTTDTGSIPLSTTKDMILITGAVTATANGTLQLEWAQNSSDADATIIHALSKMKASKQQP